MAEKILSNWLLKDLNQYIETFYKTFTVGFVKSLAVQTFIFYLQNVTKLLVNAKYSSLRFQMLYFMIILVADHCRLNIKCLQTFHLRNYCYSIRPGIRPLLKSEQYYYQYWYKIEKECSGRRMLENKHFSY